MDSITDQGNGPAQKNNSKSPYHKLRRVSEDITSITPSELPKIPASAVRSRTPVRAVFYDLPTAHSSITSRSARSGCDSASVSPLDDSIPLHELKPRQSRPGVVVPQHIPLPPLPALISREKYNLHAGVQFEPKESFPIELTERAVSDFGRAGQTRPISRGADTPTAASPESNDSNSDSLSTRLWLRGSLKLDINGSARHKSGNEKETSSSQYPDTPAPLVSLQIVNTEDRLDEELLHGEYDGGVPLQRFKPAPIWCSESPRQLLKSHMEPSSIPESSTIGKIYTAYDRSQKSDGTDLDSNDGVSDDDLPVMTPSHFQHRDACRGRSLSGVEVGSLSSMCRRESALSVRKQQRAERMMGKNPGLPPSAALPDAPVCTVPHLAPSSSEGIHPSTSYGDTRNLLEITQRTGWTAKPSNLVSSEYQQARHSDSFVSNIGASRNPVLTRRDSNNPDNGESSPQIVISHVSSDHFIFDDNPNYARLRENRQPLERDVSEALRRVSRFSVYSNESVSSSILHQTGIFQSEASGSVGAGMIRSLTFADAPQLAAEVIEEDEENSLAAEDSTFYANGALAQNWLDNHRRNAVRVPINHNGAFPESPPGSSLSDVDHPGPAARKDSEDEVDDWETVGESAFGLENRANKHTTVMLGGVVHRAGSSLANISDDESDRTASPHIPPIDQFGSTERITQHPGRIEYSGDYRQRDLKKTKQPVFLPVFREHKVNGYLADSSRIRSPPNPFNFHPKPLARTHTNPFASFPPEVMTVRGNNKSGAARHSRASPASQNPYRFSTDNTSMETDITEQKTVTIPDTKLAPLPVPEITQTYNWMDAFGDPGPAIGGQDQTLQQPRQFPRVETPDRPSSWQHVVTLANGQEVPSYNLDGSRVLDRTFNNRSPLGVAATPDSHGFVQTPTYGGLRNVTTHHACTPFIKYPAEALQRGERNISNTNDGERRARIITRFNNPKPSHAKDTKRLRPISLVEAHLPTTPITLAGRDPNEDVRPHDFVYRSPLAPPRNPEWRALYPQSHLDRIDEFAGAYGVYDLEPGETGGSLQSSRRHLYEAPRLVPWPQRSSGLPMELVERRRKIGITVLALCNLFPPLLVLYAIGQMDGVMLWWTHGDISSFGKGQKRAAYFLMGVWGAVVVFSLIILLVYSLHH